MTRTSLDRGSIAMVLFSVAMSVGSQLALRTGMGPLSELQGLPLVHAAATSPWVWTGLCVYGLGTLCWLGVLSRIDLAVAYPLGASNYVFVTLLSAILLHEVVSPVRWAGTLLILLGILTVARGERRSGTDARSIR